MNAPASSASVLRRLLLAWAQDDGAVWTLKDAASGRYLDADDHWPRLLGQPGHERTDAVGGSADVDWFDGATAAALRAAEQTALAQQAPLWSEHRIERDGKAREFRVLRVHEAGLLGALWFDRSAVRARDEQLRHALAQLEHQQQLNRELQRELADQALRDPATGLYTRAHFEDQLRREADLSVREQREFALALVALDVLSDRAQSLGDEGRALALQAAGRLLKGGTRAMDASCRFDEERFAVLLSGVGLATAHARMEGLRRRGASQIVVLHGEEFGFTVSMGVASFPHTAQTIDALVAACESALAEARRRGGNHVTLASIPLMPGS